MVPGRAADLGRLGGTIADYPEVFLTVSTHVLAAECTEAAIVEALRAGRSYVAFDVVGEGSGFDFRAVDDAGIWLPGSTVRPGAGLRLQVRTPRPGSIRFFRDGEVVRRVDGDNAELTAPAAGVYRIEVRTAKGNPWLFSSSIRVVDR